MKIAKILIDTHTVDLQRPYTIASNTFTAVPMVSVQVISANGLIGYGAGSPAADVTGETQAMSVSALSHEAVQLCVGRSYGCPQTLLQHLKLTELAPILAQAPAAQAALDMALFDLFAKRENKPLVDFLGREHRALPTSITIGIKDSLDDMCEEAREYIARGFRVIKLKLGKDLKADIEYTHALRATVPKSTVIYVDPNQAYTFERLRTYLKSTKQDNIAFVEQPVATAQTDVLLQLSEQEKQGICVDESLGSVADAERWEQSHQFPAKIFNIKLMKCGGIVQAKRIAAIAKRNQIQLMLGCMDESCASIAAALHFAYAQTSTRYIDLDGSLDLAQDLFVGGFQIVAGYMQTLDKPGLGVTPCV